MSLRIEACQYLSGRLIILAVTAPVHLAVRSKVPKFEYNSELRCSVRTCLAVRR